ncbi:MAG: hypothetical protein HOI56_05060 [Gammaproteobacteria bacterium]|jgi:dienelactone hydrolase|nr:hypothetical protein [Gammaproteobacteria bacterium]MBT4462351.1 hypothetical protein [Gammaproteobacteria bacterium]MBT4655278.1 hypothetical protein [Gammaproteobacteria bacterium]MBT5117204.1 hypothetical protein [Gammaproteobacteria bacterium]MBT5762093.1 hypothetical protein [Gammaproteobacteria bacterium]
MKLIGILIILCSLTGCSSTKVNPCDNNSTIYSKITSSKNQPICFQTIDRYDLESGSGEKLIIYGNLSFPKIKKNSYDAVIVSHGSGGIRNYHNRYIELLNNNGYAVFQIDHYLSRDLKFDKTFSKVSGITFMNDAYRALSILKTHPKINKVAYIGWSQGGVGPILSHFKHVTDFIDNGKYNFDASIAIYPYCGFTFDKKSLTTTPLLMITGRNDDLTPEKACINLYDKFKNNSNKINHISLKGSWHGYDNPYLLFGYTFDNLPGLNIINDSCTLTISERGKIITLSNEVIYGPKESASIIDRCSTKGVKVKYNADAASRTREAIIEFLDNQLR